MAKKVEEIEYRFTGDTTDLEAATSRARRALGGVGRGAADPLAKLRALQARIEGTKDKLDDLAPASTAAGSAVTGLGVVAGTGAAVIAGVGIAAVAATGALIKGTEAVIGITRAGGEAVTTFDSLKNTGFGFTDEQIGRIESANDSLDTMSLTGQLLTGTIAAELGPAVKEVARVVIALGLAGIDAFNAMAEGTDLVVDGVNLIGETMRPNIIALRTYYDAWNTVTKALGIASNHTIEAGDTLRWLEESMEDGLVPTLGRISTAIGTDYLNAADDFIGATEGIRQATDSEAAAAERAAEALAKQAKAMRLLEIAKAAAKGDNGTDKQAAIDAAALQAAKEQSASATEDQASNEKTYQAALQGTAQIVGALPGLFKKGSREAAIATKISATAQAAINTALSITSALTIPPPVGPALAIANGIAGAAQVAAIQSTPIPAFARGGVVDRSGSPYPSNGTGERLITARAGEVIFTPEQMEMMSGGMGGGVQFIELREDNRPVTRSRITQRTSRRGVTQSRDRRNAA